MTFPKINLLSCSDEWHIRKLEMLVKAKRFFFFPEQMLSQNIIGTAIYKGLTPLYQHNKRTPVELPCARYWTGYKFSTTLE